MVGQGGLQEITSLLEIKAISLAVIMVKLLEDYALQLGQFRLISLKLQQSFFKCREALPVWSTTNEEGVAQHFITFTLRHAHLYLHSRVQGKSFWASVCTLGSVVDLNHQLVYLSISSFASIWWGLASQQSKHQWVQHTLGGNWLTVAINCCNQLLWLLWFWFYNIKKHSALD